MARLDDVAAEEGSISSPGHTAHALHCEVRAQRCAVQARYRDSTYCDMTVLTTSWTCGTTRRRGGQKRATPPGTDVSLSAAMAKHPPANSIEQSIVASPGIAH
eukprot:1179123-Prorocentrum_minimum.AAC.4